MQAGKGEASVSVYYRLQVVSAYEGMPNPLELANVEGVLAEEFTGFAALYGVFPEAGIRTPMLQGRLWASQ